MRWLVVLALVGVGCGGGGGETGDPDAAANLDGGTAIDGAPFTGDGSTCVPLPAPSGTVVTVQPSQAAMLPSIIARAAADSTIVLMPGTYPVGPIRFGSNSVTLRSANNDAASVILDGTYTTPELISVSFSNVTIAHITLRHAVDHLIHVVPLDGGADVERLFLYGVNFEDAGEQFLKATRVLALHHEQRWPQPRRAHPGRLLHRRHRRPRCPQLDCDPEPVRRDLLRR